MLADNDRELGLLQSLLLTIGFNHTNGRFFRGGLLLRNSRVQFVKFALTPSKEGKSMKITYLTLLLSLCVPMLVHATDWVLVAYGDGVFVFADQDSVRRSGSRVKTWLKWQWTKPVEAPNTFPKIVYQSAKQLQVSDCAKGSFATAQSILYSKWDGGDVVYSFSSEEVFWSFTEVAPETIGESILNFACKDSSAK
jgi:hypothetical protein